MMAPINGLSISDAEFGQFRDLMRRVAGVDMPPSKKHLVSGRLSKRLREHRIGSFAEYYRMVASGQAPDEFHRMVDLLTTHETYFFREPKHFDYLAGHVLPQAAAGRELRVWSAASSSGEEAYSLAMVLMDSLGENAPWEVFASDISREVLNKARTGIYGMERIGGISGDHLKRFCLRGIGSRAGTLRIAPALRQRVRFAPMNLNESLAGAGDFDVIFLRNVLIYFDPPTKQQIVRRVVRQLKPQGWLFIGHSESLNGVSSEVRQIQPTIYRRP